MSPRPPAMASGRTHAKKFAAKAKTGIVARHETTPAGVGAALGGGDAAAARHIGWVR